MHGDRQLLYGTMKAACGPATGSRPSNVFTTRFFAPSPGFLIPLVPPALYPLLGGPPELWLTLFLVGLLSCLFLTMLEFTGLLIVANVIYLGSRWWLPDAGIRIELVAGLLVFDALLLYCRCAVFCKLRALSRANLHLAEVAMVDKVTGTYNRRYLDEEGNRIYHSFIRSGEHFSVILVDIDDFKAINDIHGHAIGDTALVALAGLLSYALRAQDAVGRYGGDEFLIVLPRTDLNETWQTAKRLQQTIAQRNEGMPDLSRDLRVSMGLAQVETTDNEFGDVVAHADAALYQAKREGRDTIRIWQPQVREPAVGEA